MHSEPPRCRQVPQLQRRQLTARDHQSPCSRGAAQVEFRCLATSLEVLGRVRGPGAPKLDFVFTVCEDAAKEVCPIWPGQPMTAHWGLPDPAKAEGTEAEQALAFADCFRMLYQRISIFVSLPFDRLKQVVAANGARPDRQDASRRHERDRLSCDTGHRAGRSAPLALTRIGAPLMSHGRLLPYHFLVAFRRFYASPAGMGA
jgi:hypothetical protein